MERITQTKWIKWMENYPSENGLKLIIPRGKKEVSVGYWNNKTRRFEEAVPEFTDKGIDVDYWSEFPFPPCIEMSENQTLIDSSLSFFCITNSDHINIDNILEERYEVAKRYNENPNLAIEIIIGLNQKIKNILGL